MKTERVRNKSDFTSIFQMNSSVNLKLLHKSVIFSNVSTSVVNLKLVVIVKSAYLLFLDNSSDSKKNKITPVYFPCGFSPQDLCIKVFIRYHHRRICCSICVSACKCIACIYKYIKDFVHGKKLTSFRFNQLCSLML